MINIVKKCAIRSLFLEFLQEQKQNEFSYYRDKGKTFRLEKWSLGLLAGVMTGSANGSGAGGQIYRNIVAAAKLRRHYLFKFDDSHFAFMSRIVEKLAF